MSKRDDHYIPKTNKVKLLVLGDAGIFIVDFIFKIAVGKTSVTRNFTRSTFEQNYISTLGIDYETRRFNVDGEDVSLQVFILCLLQIWDTAGQEKFRSITKAYYKGSNGVILMYDITLRSSFDHINQWVPEIYKETGVNIAMILVGNKHDLDKNRVYKI